MLAPLAVSEVEAPEQIVAGADAVTVGLGFTVMVIFAVLVHPPVAVPVTV